MNSDLEVKPSEIHDKGVFAKRRFLTGETVLKWDCSKILSERDLQLMPKDERIYVHPFKGSKFIRIMPPERYVNHSCDNNTKVENYEDIAIRQIEPGEEITSDYGSDGSGSHFKCKCGSSKCRGVVGQIVKKSAP